MQRILIIVLVLAVVLGFMVTYVVRFNEAAVLTTFGRADESSVLYGEKDAGAHFKLPYPFQKVTTYDTRLRFIESDKETQATAGSGQVLLTSFLTWRVKDPLKFYKAFGGSGDTSAADHYAKAERILKAKLRTAGAKVSQYRLDELLTSDPKASKLDALESQMLASLQASGEGDSSLSAYGIEAQRVGVSGLDLPPATTTQVFNAMKAARDKIANSTRVKGTSEASRIRSEAETDAKKIQAFADQLAANIRSEGDKEAVQFLSQMKQDPQLAVFIQNMDFMRSLSTTRTTLVLPTRFPGFEMFQPDASKKFGGGRPPTPKMPDFMGAKLGEGTPDAPAQKTDDGAKVAGGSR
ncbi:MAG TPA: SPFH domain-containing protein [Phycisphaerales bacterium]|nr:SPFH domain-containing protein [Phycisphaerales bacterium]